MCRYSLNLFFSQLNINTYNIDLDLLLWRPWYSTPLLCSLCRSGKQLTRTTIRSCFENEHYSYTIANSSKHAVAIDLNTEQRLFPLIYTWLTLQITQQLHQIGITSIHNFWFLISPVGWNKSTPVNFPTNLIITNTYKLDAMAKSVQYQSIQDLNSTLSLPP